MNRGEQRCLGVILVCLPIIRLALLGRLSAVVTQKVLSFRNIQATVSCTPQTILILDEFLICALPNCAFPGRKMVGHEPAHYVG